jgi:O-methyltransferase domain
MEERIAVTAGSFFDGVPADAEVYLLVRVLHDWGDQDCLRILRACRRTMAPETLLLIGELILAPDPARGWSTAYLADMQMMAMFGNAREQTEAEFRDVDHSG